MLNELAQGLAPPDVRGHHMVRRARPGGTVQCLLVLRHHCVRARAVTGDGPEGIRRAGLRPTHTPAVLIRRGRINDQLEKIASLTSRDERQNAFRLLVAVLAFADGRRREHYCSDGCGHWWHMLYAAD
ncbi:DUF5958 family protein [Streptomyces sp. NPDC059278]|uniref:DUF5958 family protein n=1 Tax=Streptomyces sp. NPDC059278 TaxID=3346801 RepID=UPI00369F4B74